MDEGKPHVDIPPLSPWVLAFASITTVVSGIFSAMSTKLQNRQYNFFAPFWQELIMFSGECLCFLVWTFDEYYFKGIRGRAWGLFEYPRPDDLKKPPTPFWWWAFPSVLDLVATSLQLIAETITYASTVAIFRNLSLILSAFTTIILMRRPLRYHEWIGVIVMTVGLIFGAMSAVLHPDETSVVSANKAWLGIVCTIVGTIASSVQLVVEEKFLSNHYCPPLKAVGCEGIFGLLVSIPCIVVPHAIKFNKSKRGRLIDMAYPWWLMNHNSKVMAGNFLFLFAVVFFNGAGLITTQLGSGLLRAGLMYACRAPFIWFVELTFKWSKFEPFYFAGLIILVIGFFIYSYHIPFVNRRRTPNAHRTLRKGLPCFCTHELPDSDTEEIVVKGATYSSPETTGHSDFYRDEEKNLQV